MPTWFSHFAVKTREALWPVRTQQAHEPVQPARAQAIHPPRSRFYEACDEDNSLGSPEEESQIRGLQEEEEEVDDGRPFDWEEPEEDEEEDEEEE